MYQLNNAVPFSGKPIGFEKFINRIVETLGMTIDRRSIRKTSKKGKLNHRINMICLYLN